MVFLSLSCVRKSRVTEEETLTQVRKKTMEISLLTDIGQKRSNNQDFVNKFVNQAGVTLVVVADGMGGHNAGDFASKYAVETLLETIRVNPENNPIKIIRTAIETANSSILKEAAEHETMSGMGTTIVLTTIVGDYAYVANVGDSRLYLINDERIIQITKDHSLVEEMVRMGEISEEDARNHPDKNVITRALGATKDVAVDFFDVHLESGDRLLLCSDGLTNMVLDEDIEDIIVSEELLETAGKRLVEAANENGGKDNIGIVLVEPDTKEVEVC